MNVSKHFMSQRLLRRDESFLAKEDGRAAEYSPRLGQTLQSLIGVCVCVHIYPYIFVYVFVYAQAMADPRSLSPNARNAHSRGT